MAQYESATNGAVLLVSDAATLPCSGTVTTTVEDDAGTWGCPPPPRTDTTSSWSPVCTLAEDGWDVSGVRDVVAYDDPGDTCNPEGFWGSATTWTGLVVGTDPVGTYDPYAFEGDRSEVEASDERDSTQTVDATWAGVAHFQDGTEFAFSSDYRATADIFDDRWALTVTDSTCGDVYAASWEDNGAWQSWSFRLSSAENEISAFGSTEAERCTGGDDVAWVTLDGVRTTVRTDTWETVTDGDGAYSGIADCDDANPSASPCLSEVCDGIDNDCDGTTDEGNEWYDDADEDGYGDTNTAVISCEDSLAGKVRAAGDCDDTDPTRPAAEICGDGVDGDCDGADDDDDRGTGWWDEDGDGYGGEPASSAMDCGRGLYVANGDDCDDGDAGAHPDAPEQCDEADQDCDGVVDEGACDTAEGDSGANDSGAVEGGESGQTATPTEEARGCQGAGAFGLAPLAALRAGRRRRRLA